MKSFLAPILGFVLFSFVAHGSVTITTGATGIMRDQLGSMISLGSVAVLVADTDGNNLANAYGTTLTIGNTLGNTGSDLIIGIYQAVDLGTNQIGFDLSGTSFSYGGATPAFGVGDSLYLVWFPSISALNATVGSGVSYGTFRTDSINNSPGAVGTMAWTAPTDGTNQSLFSLDSALGGSPAITAAQFTASQITAVPEPSTYALLGIAALGMTLMRRKRRVC